MSVCSIGIAMRCPTLIWKGRSILNVSFYFGLYVELIFFHDCALTDVVDSDHHKKKRPPVPTPAQHSIGLVPAIFS